LVNISHIAGREFNPLNRHHEFKYLVAYVKGS
jgi:hypothetical protein